LDRFEQFEILFSDVANPSPQMADIHFIGELIGAVGHHPMMMFIGHFHAYN
jgi:hypothetical protein